MEAASWQKKQFSRAYLHALAAREGLPVGSWNVDKDGVDATLRRGALMRFCRGQAALMVVAGSSSIRRLSGPDQASSYRVWA